jgi:hypothetical protein
MDTKNLIEKKVDHRNLKIIVVIKNFELKDHELDEKNGLSLPDIIECFFILNCGI